MPRTLLPVIVFSQFAGTSLWFAGNAVLGGVAGFSTAALTASVQIGFIGGTLLFSVMALADRVAAERLFLFAALLGALANSCIPFLLHQPAQVLLLRTITGFFLAGIYPVGMKIAAVLFKDRLAKAMGWLVGALVLGTAFPHLLKDLLRQAPPEGVLWSVSALAAAGGLLLYACVPRIAAAQVAGIFPPAAIGTIWRHRQFRGAALGYLGHMWELYTFWAFVPLLLTNVAAGSQRQVALLSFCVIGIGAVGCIVGGAMARSRGSRQVSAVALAVSGLCCILLPAAMHLPSGLYACFLLVWGFAVVADSPQLSTLAAQTAPPHLKGTALTLLTCAGFAVTVFSLLIIQYLAARLATPALALVALAPGPVLGLWGLYRKQGA